MAPVMFEIKAGITLAGLSAFSAVGAMLFMALAVGALVNGGETEFIGFRFGVWESVWLTILLTAIAFIFRTYAFKVSHNGAFALEEILRTRIAGHLAKVPMGYILTTGSGALKKVMVDDVMSLHAFVADSTPFIGRTIAAPVASMALMFIIDWRLALVSTIVLVIGFTVMGFVMRDAASYRKKYEEGQEMINSAVIEFVQAMPVVRTFDDGKSSFMRYQTALDIYKKGLKEWINATGIPARIGLLILSPIPTLLAVTAAGIYFKSAGTLSFSAFVAALMMSTGMADAMMPLMWLNNFIKKSQAGAFRINEVLNSPVLSVSETPKEPQDSSVVFENVFFRYSSRKEYALRDVSFEVPKGTVTAVVGPSGAGKSTVAKLIPRFWDVESGCIKVGGIDVRNISPEKLMEHVSFVFQDTFLFHDSLSDNIRMAKPDATHEEIIKAAKAACIHDFIMTLPDGYSTKAGDRGARLSGGQKQRITIARAILRDAPVIVLDEATAFADPENEEEIIRAIANLTKNKTVIVIAHRLSTIRDVDQIIVMDGGCVVERGRHEYLKDSGGIYARLWGNYEQAQSWDISVRERKDEAS